MSEQYPGGYVTKAPPSVTTSSAPGLWTLSQQAGYQKQGLWPQVPVPDAQFNYVTMLLHGDGTNGAQNNTFLDSSTNNFTITRNGDPTQGSFSPYGSNWSNYFDGSGDYLSVPDNSALEGFTNFTFECWLYVSDFASGDIVFAKGFGPGYCPYMFYFTSTDLVFYASSSLSSWDVADSQTIVSNIVKNQWYHVAASRSGSSIKLFSNGAVITSLTNGSTLGTNASTFNVASAVDGTRNPEIYISNLRINNTALYTAAFTPSTTPLTAVSGTALLTCQSNRFIDNSTNAFTVSSFGNSSVQRFNPFGASTAYSTSVIGGSGYFSASYLTAPSNSAFAMGTGDFTIECWINTPVVNTNNDVIIELRSSGSTSTGFVFNMNPTGVGYQLNFYTDGGFNLGSTVLNYNVWNHCAVTRSGTTVRLFSNGVVSATFTKANNFSDTPIPSIGYSPLYSPSNLNGYMTDLRVVKGTALYTSTFTPPTTPLTAVGGTSLLLNYTNGAIFDNAMIADIRTANDAQISTSVVKYGTVSLKFDGTGDYLIGNFASNNLYSFGTGDFTVEMWLYTSNLSDYQALIDTRSGDTQSAWCLFLDNTGKPYWYDASGVQSSSTALSSNTWTHLAVSRSGSTIRIFLSGIQVFSGTNTNSQNPTGTFYVARSAINAYLYNGYIDDLRITKGYARYTANFTPPTAAFPNVGPTV